MELRRSSSEDGSEQIDIMVIAIILIFQKVMRPFIIHGQKRTV